CEGAGAHIDEDARRSECVVPDLDVARASEAAVALVDGDTGIAPEAALDTARGEAEHVILALVNLLHVDADRAIDHNAVFARAPRHMRNVGAGNQRLGRRATGVDAGAAEAIALDDGDVHACPCQTVRQGGPGLTGTDDDRIERLHFDSPCLADLQARRRAGREGRLLTWCKPSRSPPGLMSVSPAFTLCNKPTVPPDPRKGSPKRLHQPCSWQRESARRQIGWTLFPTHVAASDKEIRNNPEPARQDRPVRPRRE